MKQINTKLVSTLKNIRVAPQKLNCILDKIRGKSYLEVLQVLRKTPWKSGQIIWKLLKQNIASVNTTFPKESLFISEAYANKGSILKRVRFRARGRSFSIQKKMSHLTISLQYFKKV